MKISKLKIKLSDEFVNLKNFFNNEFKKFSKFIKFKIIKYSIDYFKYSTNYFVDKFIKFPKFIKFKIIKYSTNYFKYSTNYFGDKFKKFKNIKFIKISNLSVSIILFVTLLFLYLFYLSVPTLYNKEALQKDVTDKLIKEFKINFSLSSDIRYLILPSPHILVENVKIFDDNLKDPKELSQINITKKFV